MIKADKTDAKYEISDVSLEYDTVTQPHLARLIQRKYENMALPYERVVRHSQIEVNKSDRIWSWTFNETCKSLKGILVLFEKEADFSRDTSNFYNPKIEEVSITVEGDTNQLYAQGMRSFEQYEEICKYFAAGNHKDNNASEVRKELHLSDLSVREYIKNKYGLWLDFRSIDENDLHGTGRRIENASGIILWIQKKTEASGTLNAYIYLIMDALLNIEDGRFRDVVY